MQVVVETAQRSLPGVDHAGVSVTHRGGRVETVAGTDQLVWQLDELQYELNEGPCLDAIRKDPVVQVNCARHDQRWPAFIPRALSLGLRSQLAVRLYDDNDTLGALNLYSTTAEELDPEVPPLAELLATQAALAMGHTRKEQDLSAALTSRKTIGQAIGIVMERYALDEDRAFAFLTRVSQTTNTKLREVAADIVATTDEEHRRSRPDPGTAPHVS